MRNRGGSEGPVSNWKPIAVVAAVSAFCLFWDIGTYPPHYQSKEIAATHVQVMRLFQGAEFPNDVSWAWGDGESGAASHSAPISLLSGVGLKLFGFSLFGIRVMPALLALVSLLATYATLARYVSPRRALVFCVLLASSPWYLMFARSASSAGLTLSMTLISLSLLAPLLAGRATREIPCLAAGASLALLNHGYMIVRPLVLVALGLLALSPQVTWRRKGLFVLGAALVLSTQLPTLSESLRAYFHARGESIQLSDIQEAGVASVLRNVAGNAGTVARLLTRCERGERNLLYNDWRAEVQLVRCAILPFSIIGSVGSVLATWRGGGLWNLAPWGLLLIGILPGLFGRMGHPNAQRLLLASLPLCFWAASAIDWGTNWLEGRLRRRGPSRSAGLDRVPVGLLTVLLSALGIWQWIGYRSAPFAKQDLRHFRTVAAHASAWLKNNPGGRLLICPGGEKRTGRTENIQILFAGGEPLIQATKQGALIYCHTEKIPTTAQLEPPTRGVILMRVKHERPWVTSLGKAVPIDGTDGKFMMITLEQE